MSLTPVIGLEIHVQLSTRSKIFSGASTAFGAPANSQACAVDLGMPGVLPVVNAEVYQKAIRFGLAIGAHIAPRSSFDRKNYFYPDLPKGYQITQLAEPIVEHGTVEIETDDGTKVIRVLRAHLEEDAGKSLHEDFQGHTGVDLNRAGTPLIEVVSEPDLASADEAVAYARAVHRLVQWLDVSDGNMAEGSFRCDANVSLHEPGTPLGTRTETKNVNSFRFLERAINYEIRRQRKLIEAGEVVVQETRLYDPDKDETRPMRSKETSKDYRYFSEPDLLPVEVTESAVDAIRKAMPELPGDRCDRFAVELGLSADDAATLTASRALADYFESVAERAGDARLAANWVRVELLGALNREGLDISASPVSAEQLAGVLLRISDNTISGKIAKTVFEALWQGADSADAVIEAQGLKQMSGGDTIAPIVDEVIAANPRQVEQYQGGKTKLLGFFVGQVMKLTQGKANPQEVNALVKARLD
ncbi:MAG: Asp-tRNA(Asn)/Glu-tRNA(Gln) amidotransferase GatCAB subunit B [Gammaproteobacteria bacterium]|nr:Asp-tRNA(Asn)/Glu-tRNA(Gln) amidotransferase GatCAB subunit B [Gammaproteobacteria bacterium]